jgi:V/A-type H+-transporting ATPase subunit D
LPDGRQTTPTRSAYLELKEERQLVREGYEFLDEKRMIVAQEMLRQLDGYRKALLAYREAHVEAIQSLGRAAARHGLEGITVYPTPRLQGWTCEHEIHRFLGVELIDTHCPAIDWKPGAAPAVASPEAEDCREQFMGLMPPAAELAARSANLRRLIEEYTRTERRARALENVLLPEIDESIRFMEEQLEAVDLEEALRVRFVDRST